MTNQHSKPKARDYVNKIALTGFWLVALIAFLVPVFKNYETESIEPIVEQKVLEIPDFSSIQNVKEKKRAFFAYLIPEITTQNELLLEQRSFILSMQQKLTDNDKLSASNIDKVENLALKYRVNETLPMQAKIASLIVKVDIIPTALVLVQAANESAWGTSRFAVKGYNFFGLWCFKTGCGFVPRSRNEGANHEVAKFRNLSHAVATYLTNLNRHEAYKELRSIRSNLRANEQKVTAEALVHGLTNYSERGQDYIDELLHMIQFNRKFMNP
jgi:Bax protein